MAAARIGIDARFYRRETGGLGRYTRELIHQISYQDHIHEYVVFLTPADMAEWPGDTANVRAVQVDVTHYTGREQTELLKAIKREKVDMVHFLHFNHPVLYRGPFVVTLHDLTMVHQIGEQVKNLRARLRRIPFLAIVRHAVRSSKKVIAISEFTAQDIVKTYGVTPARVEMIYEGYPQPQPLPFGAKNMVQDYLGTRKPYILFLSQWRSHKGIMTLLDAFEHFKAETGLPHVLVLVGGQKSVTEEVKNRLTTHPFAEDIIAPGFAPDELLPMLYSYAAVFAMPSEYEGFGLPVLEALSYGAPTVVAKNSSLPEVGGKAVRYFETGNSGQLANEMIRLATHPETVEALRAKIPAHLKHFGWETMAKRTLEVYRAVLEKQHISW